MSYFFAVMLICGNYLVLPEDQEIVRYADPNPYYGAPYGGQYPSYQFPMYPYGYPPYLYNGYAYPYRSYYSYRPAFVPRVRVNVDRR